MPDLRPEALGEDQTACVDTVLGMLLELKELSMCLSQFAGGLSDDLDDTMSSWLAECLDGQLIPAVHEELEVSTGRPRAGFLQGLIGRLEYSVRALRIEPDLSPGAVGEVAFDLDPHASGLQTRLWDSMLSAFEEAHGSFDLKMSDYGHIHAKLRNSLSDSLRASMRSTVLDVRVEAEPWDWTLHA